MKLLRIDSSARKNSVSRLLTANFVDSWRQQNPDGEVIERNLATTNLPHVTDEWVRAAFTDPANLTTEQRLVLATSDTLIEELRQADVIVLGAPMYNFAIAAPLKAWIDQIVRVGQTIVYGPSGPKGILEGKKVYVITSRGGAFRRARQRNASIIRNLIFATFWGLSD